MVVRAENDKNETVPLKKSNKTATTTAGSGTTAGTAKGKASATVEYAFEYYSAADRHLVIEPVLQSESNILFYPRSKPVSVEDECVSNIQFQAKNGLVIKGKVEPPTEGVSIRIINNKTGEEVAQVQTDSAG